MKTLTRDQAVYAATQAAMRAGIRRDVNDPPWAPPEWVIDAILTATSSGDIAWVTTELGGTVEVSGERYGLKITGRYPAAADDAAALDYRIRRVISGRLGAQRPNDDGGTQWIRRIAVGGGVSVLNPKDDGGPTVLVHRAEGAPTPTA